MGAIEAAVKRLGGTFLRDQKTHAWYGAWVNDWRVEQAASNRRDPATFGKCDHAIRFPESTYEVGLCKEEDGTYALVYDSWGPGKGLVDKLGGLDLPVLKDEYAAAAATRVMARRGFRVTRADVNGKIVLKATM